MAARVLLPEVGGSSAVWIHTLVFFQTMLLTGYWLSHRVAQRIQLQALIPILIFASSIAAIAVPIRHLDVVGSVEVQVWTSLLVAVGLPTICLYLASPWIQHRIADVFGTASYRLYAWSNAGALLGLLAYPLIIEPQLSLESQKTIWSYAYLLFAAGLLSFCKDERIKAPHAKTHRRSSTFLQPDWIAYSALGVSLLISTSDAISTDLTISPILWVLPMVVYLLTFILTFGFPNRWQHKWPLRGWFVGLLIFGYLRDAHWGIHWAVQLTGWCLVLCFGCLFLHRELVRRQPATPMLTGYYLSMAIGGVIGGIVISTILPQLLPVRIELDLVVLMISVMVYRDARRRSTDEPDWRIRPDTLLALMVLAGAIFVLGVRTHKLLRGDVAWYRNAYGTLCVKTYDVPKSKGGLVHLLDGRISHGYQYRGEVHRREPTAYFTRKSGIGRVLDQKNQDLRVGILGLGVGTLAAYADEGDSFTFYELNPLVAQIARERFSYLSDARGHINVILGDGRRSLEAQSPQAYDRLVIDAFTGDAIPAHLLTIEAFELYLRHLAANGILAINVSNRHADLRMVVAGVSQRLKLSLAHVKHRARSPFGPYLSEWILISKSPATLTALELPIVAVPSSENTLYWTDDFSPLLPILR